MLSHWIGRHQVDGDGQRRRQVEALVHQYGYVLRRRCQRILQDEALVDDAMQEIWIILCRRYEQYEGDPREILRWLYRIASNQCLQLLDKHQRWKRNLSLQLVSLLEREASMQATVSVEGRLALERFLEELPSQQREAVLYRYVSGMTQEEIAEVMGVSRDRVRRWLTHFQQRGRIVLREGQGDD